MAFEWESNTKCMERSAKLEGGGGGGRLEIGLWKISVDPTLSTKYCLLCVFAIHYRSLLSCQLHALKVIIYT